MLTAEKKVWGTAIKIHDSGLSKTSVLHIQKGGTCSWHYHKHRYNAFYVISGSVVIRWSPSPNSKEKYELYLIPGNDDTIIGPGEVHQFAALEDSVVVEIDYINDQIDDIVRLKPGFKAKRIRDKRVKNIKL